MIFLTKNTVDFDLFEMSSFTGFCQKHKSSYNDFS